MRMRYSLLNGDDRAKLGPRAAPIPPIRPGRGARRGTGQAVRAAVAGRGGPAPRQPD
jgi:hypothetical protein